MPTTTGNATQLITFSRGSLATVTDSDGRIKWAGHNLLTNSESFDASAWSKTHTASAAPVVTANAGVAPNGTTTADRADMGAIDASGDYSQLAQSATTAAGTYTGAVWVKAFAAGDVGKKIWLYLYDTTERGIVSATLTDSWQLITTSFALSGAASFAMAIATLGSAFSGGANQGAVSVLLWGAHLYRSDLGGMVLNPARGDAYYPTTPRNLLGFTEDFSNAAWDKSFFGTTATSNNLIAPNGLQTADLITAINSTNDHVVYQSSGINLAASGVVTGSIYVKANTATFVRCGVVDNASGTDWAGFIVNLSTGAVTNTYTGANASNVTTHTPVSVGNGWYRIGITATLTASANNLSLRVGPFNAASASPGNYFSVSWAAAGTESIYLWGAQLSDSASLDAYSPVYGAAVTSAAYYAPRLDYDANGSALGLLVEEQRTNLIIWTADFRNTADAGSSRPWIYNNVTVTPNDAVAPDGTMTADRINPSSNAAIYYQLTSPASATTWTFSIWLRSATGSSFTMPYYVNGAGANPNPQTGTLGTVTTQWQRFSFQITTASSSGTANIALGNFSTGWASGNNVLAWGAQLEAGTFATSYLPNAGVTAGVTRTADVASVSTQAFPYSATEGTVVASGRAFNFAAGNSTNCLAALSDGTTSNANYVYSFGDTPYSATTNGGNVQANITAGSALSPNTVFKLGYAIKTNDFAFTSNGASVGTDTSGSVPTANQLQLGRVGSAIILNGHIRQITYIPRRLSNSELQARTV